MHGELDRTCGEERAFLHKKRFSAQKVTHHDTAPHIVGEATFEYSMQFWLPNYRKNVTTLKRVQM